MIVTLDEYWKYITNMRDELLKSIPKVQNAFVVGLTSNGEPVLRFMGEIQPSKKIYPHYKSYQPAIGDRVQLLDGVIQGGWKPRS